MRMVSLTSVLSSIALSQGCGQSSETSPGDAGVDAGISGDLPLFRSGTRLKARVYSLGGPAKRFKGWYDSLLNINCSFKLANDGKTRCLPDQQDEFDIYFTQACDTLYIATNSASKYFGTYSENPTCGSARYFEVLESVAPPKEYYAGKIGICSLWEQNLPDAESSHYRTKEADLSQFAVASPMQSEGTERFGTLYWIAEGGAVQAVSIYDRMKQVQCEKNTDLESNLCLPKSGNESFPISDRFGVPPTCEEKLGSYWDPGNCTEHGYIVRTETTQVDRCTFQYSSQYFLTGEEISQEDVGSGDACEATTDRTPGYRYFQRGSGVALSEFSATTTKQHSGSRILSSSEMSESGKELLANAELFDSELNVSCRPGFMGDTLRCAPTATVQDLRNNIPQMFSDSNCSTRVFARSVSDSSRELCGDPVKYFAKASEPGACYFSNTKEPPGTCHLTEITSAELLDINTYSTYQLLEEVCQPMAIERQENHVGIAVYTFGSTVALDTFFEFVESSD